MEPNAEPSVEQKPVEKEQSANNWLPIVSNGVPSALKIKSDAEVNTCSLQKNKTVKNRVKAGWGCYLYVLEGNPVQLNGKTLPVLGAAMVSDESELTVTAKGEAELLLVSVLL